MYKSNYRVRFDDVDGAGIVYYPRFFHFCHKTFEDFFNDNCSMSYPELIVERKVGFPTVHIESDFIKPIFYGDTIEIAFKVKSLSRSAVTCIYEFFNEKSKALSFKTLMTVVCTNLHEKKSMTIPNDLRELLLKFTDA